jgi:hypothetical protein
VADARPRQITACVGTRLAAVHQPRAAAGFRVALVGGVPGHRRHQQTFDTPNCSRAHNHIFFQKGCILINRGSTILLISSIKEMKH